MMAGVFTKRGTSGRKQWTLHDGPRGSIKGLRNQLANDGCPESQVVLGKQLLEEETDIDLERRENARLGVYWLIKASEQGNTEATEILTQCLDSGKGISEHNYLDVKSCISMTQDEKLARKAAREMFASLSNGGEYITSDQLQRKMLSLDRDEKSCSTSKLGQIQNGHMGQGEPSNGELVKNYDDYESEDENWTQRSDSNEKLTEDNLVAAAVNYAQGQLPIVNRSLCLNDPNLNALDNIPVMHRSVLHPLLAMRILYYKLIRFLGRQPFFEYFKNVKTDIQLIFILLIYTLCSSENIIYFLPLVVYYLTIIVMVITTFQMLQTKREFFDFRIWSGLFISYSGGSLNAQEAEFQFIRNNLKPYGHFFVALLLNLIAYPIISQQYVLQSELTIFAFCLTFMTLFGFMYKKRSKTIIDALILFSFGINVLAKYPYEIDPVVTQGWRFLELKVPTFASYVVGNGIEFCINFRTLLYTFIPILLLRIGYRDNWTGIYKYLIPHCVTLSWLQIIIISSQGATMFGLIRGTLALVGVVLFLPLVGLTTIFLPAAALAKWMVNTDYIYTISMFILFAIIGISLCFLLAKTRFNKYTGLLQMIFAIAAFYFLLTSAVNDRNISRQIYLEKQTPKSITYEQYQKFCYGHAWESQNVAVTQLRCSKLQNVAIKWEGYVHDVRVKTVRNKYKYLIDKLPEALSQYCYCYYGDQMEADCKLDELNDCLVFYDIITSNRKCSLDKYNIYEFEIVIKMQSGMWGKSPDIILQVLHEFKNFTLALRANDHIWFKGILNHNYILGSNGLLGGLKPHVMLHEIGCMGCQDIKLSSMKLNFGGTNKFGYKRLINDVIVGLKAVLNFIFYPIVVFK